MKQLTRDVAVVGAGTAGAAAALAFARRGASVVVVDRRPDGRTGARWIDSVPLWCFERAGIDAPSGDELFNAEHGRLVLHPAGRGALFSVESNAVAHIDVPRVVARMLRQAYARGVERVTAGVVDARFDAEVATLTLDTGAAITSKLVIDASGLRGAIRRRSPALAAACPEPGPEDLCLASTWTYDVKDKDAAIRFIRRYGAEPGDVVALPGLAGGYSTLTVFTLRSMTEICVLAGSIPALGYPPGPKLLASFEARADWLGTRKTGGQGAIPLRRPYATLGRDRVALVGDSACQVFASHGSGVGMGVVAADLLAAAASSTRDPGGPTALATYERTFHRELGGLLASADAFRRFSSALPIDDLVSLVRTGILDGDIALPAMEQRRTRLDLAQLRRTAGRAVRAPRLSSRFAAPALRTLALGALCDWMAPPATPRARQAWESLIETLIGPRPSAVSPTLVELPHFG
ncbi:MAG: tryptophan 7-halogenase [Polyangiaceae bacterium]